MNKVEPKYPNGVPIGVKDLSEVELPVYTESTDVEVDELYNKLSTNYKSDQTKDISYRKKQLINLMEGIKLRYHMLIEAMVRDFKARNEAVLEVSVVLQEIVDFLENIDDWCQPQNVATPLGNAFDTAQIIYEPFGLWLNISPWNFPTVLSLTPLIGAIAAGNACVLKPSELSFNSAAVLKLIIEESLDKDFYGVINGAKEITTKVLEKKWDFILYTGNSTVARIVMQAASKYLTPVALELGGKSPAFIDHNTTDLRIAARRIIWGKMMNAGQICIAVDYVILHPSIRQKFISILKEEIINFYSKETETNPDWPKIVHKRHVERIAKLLPKEDSPKEHGKVYYGGNYNVEKRYFEPTIISDFDLFKAPIMNEEIFGPILPIIEIENIDEAINYLKSKDKPLALYIFSDDKKYINKLTHSISSGGVCINDTLSHFLVPTLPFGGVGESGMGSYHGLSSFQQFSHKRSVLNSTKFRNLEPLLSLRYPPAQIDVALPLNFSSLLYPNQPTSNVIGYYVNKIASALSWIATAAKVGIFGRPDGKKFSYSNHVSETDLN